MNLFMRKPRQRLSPNQRWVDHILGWGVEHPGIQRALPNVVPEMWRLNVDGLVGITLSLDWDAFMALDHMVLVSDFHCVETWSVKDLMWEGVPFRTIMNLANPLTKARFVLFECYDGYTSSLPLRELLGENIVLAHRLNEEPLPQPLGGPMRLVVPHKYGYKSPMWLNRITFSGRDKLGYWERGAYSNSGDPWHNDRYTLR